MKKFESISTIQCTECKCTTLEVCLNRDRAEISLICECGWTTPIVQNFNNSSELELAEMKEYSKEMRKMDGVFKEESEMLEKKDNQSNLQMLSGVIETAGNMGVTIDEFFKVLQWLNSDFGVEYMEIEESMIGRITIYKNLNETIEALISPDGLDGLLDLNLLEYLEHNNLLVLEDSQKIVHFDAPY